MELRQLSTNGDSAVVASPLGQVGQSPMDPVWRLEHDAGGGGGGDSVERLAAFPATARQESLEAEAPGGETRQAKGSEHRTRSGNRLYRDPPLKRRGNQLSARVAHQRSSRVTHQCVVSACNELVDDGRAPLFAAVRMKRAERGVDPMVRAQRPACVACLPRGSCRLHRGPSAPAA